MRNLLSCLSNFLFLCMTFSAISLSAQHYYDFGFTGNQTIPVIHGTDTLLQPWVGGINSVHFSEIDLNLDGQNDLVAFEKHGNRLLPFLRMNNTYRYAPQYKNCFPKLHDWAIFKDYNHDQQADIFTYGLAGISVYRNNSQNRLHFQLVSDQLNSYYYNGYINIFSSPDDYLAVEDVDGDGNIDLLNFWVLGKYVHYQRNYGDYNGANPFDYHLEDECWGKFSEAADNNTISLNTHCADKHETEDNNQQRHTGSSMLLHDFDDNGLADLLLGDVDSPHLILLYNHGSATEAYMTEQDTCFPAGGNPMNLYSMPSPALIQLPHSSRPSLLVSPSDPDLTKSQDLNSVWQYDYDTLVQQYALVNTAFLQEDMIDVGSGCYPVLFDWNQDGLLDLFLSNYGSYDSTKIINGFVHSYFSSSIRYYQNVGTATLPAFLLMDNDFGHLKADNYQALFPTFGDFDGDGLTDMVCGQKDGTLLLLPHSRLTDPQNSDITTSYLGIDAGDFSTPQYFDLDQDGQQDLIIGNRRGMLIYYRNIATQGSPQFQHITDSLGQVDVRDYTQSYFGFSVPCFYRDAQHGTVLFCGSEQGYLFEYNNIDHNIAGCFTLADSTLAETFDTAACKMNEGIRLGIAIADITADAYPDLFVGNYAGGVSFFEGSTPMLHQTTVQKPVGKPAIELFPNPTADFITIRADREIRQLTLFDLSGRALWTKQLQSTTANLDLHAFVSGIYILVTELDDHTTVRNKIIKQ